MEINKCSLKLKCFFNINMSLCGKLRSPQNKHSVLFVKFLFYLHFHQYSAIHYFCFSLGSIQNANRHVLSNIWDLFKMYFNSFHTYPFLFTKTLIRCARVWLERAIINVYALLWVRVPWVTLTCVLPLSRADPSPAPVEVLHPHGRAALTKQPGKNPSSISCEETNNWMSNRQAAYF